LTFATRYADSPGKLREIFKNPTKSHLGWSSAAFDDELDSGARCEKVGLNYTTIKLAIFRDDELLIDDQMVHLQVDA
jgi:hypothetical protein